MFKYATIVTRSIYIPGDERSRTHPGHGYPASTEEYTDFVTFDNEEKLKAWIRSNSSSKFKVIKYQEMQYSIALDVNLGP